MKQQPQRIRVSSMFLLLAAILASHCCVDASMTKLWAAPPRQAHSFPSKTTATRQGPIRRHRPFVALRPSTVWAASSSSLVDDDNNNVDTYDSLNWLGKAVAGTIEVLTTVLIEYASGFMGGYLIGTITDVPRLLFRKISEDKVLSAFQEASQRTWRMHQKSVQWGQSWAGLSAAFGGFRVAVKVLRDGKEDEWTTVLSSMAAGAYFSRAEGPSAMLRGAIFYGGFVYLLSGFGMGQHQPFEYEEQVVEF